MPANQPQEQQTIPLAVDSDFKLHPIRANFPEPKVDQWDASGQPKVISFDPSPLTRTDQPKGFLDSQPFNGTTHVVLNMPSGTIVMIVAVIAAAAVAIAFWMRKK